MNTQDKIKLLFVDDEQRLLDGLRRHLHPYRNEWESKFVDSGPAALELLATYPADIVVSDMRMPGMNGGELLQRILDNYPHIVRIMLSGQTDESELLRNIGPIHFYLHKPCEINHLLSSIKRTAQLVQHIHRPPLQRIIGRITSLPPGPDIYRRLLAELANPAATSTSIARLIEQDVALVAKLLQLVNSAFFGLPRAVMTASAAVSMLGLRTIQSIVVAGRVFEHLAVASNSRASLDGLWRLSAQIGSAAADIALRRDTAPVDIDRVRLAGLFSLLGRAILVIGDPEHHDALVARATTGEPLSDLELESYGASQEAIGAYALGIWGFDNALVDIVAHHVPGDGDCLPHHQALCEIVREARIECNGAGLPSTVFAGAATLPGRRAAI